MSRVLSHVLSLTVLLFSAGWSVSSASTALAAKWLAPAAGERITAGWVKQIEADLTGDRFKDVFASMPADPPIPAILKMLNNADGALANDQKDYARSFVDHALRILDSGIGKGWYGREDIEPVKAMITARAEAALQGKAAEGHSADPRWTGYSDSQALGLTDAMGEKQRSYRPDDAASAADPASPGTGLNEGRSQEGGSNR